MTEKNKDRKYTFSDEGAGVVKKESVTFYIVTVDESEDERFVMGEIKFFNTRKAADRWAIKTGKDYRIAEVDLAARHEE